MPEVTINLPTALGLMVVIMAIGAAVVFSVLRGTGRVVEPTVTPTTTLTTTPTTSPTATSTSTPEPTFTPLPPLEYTVKDGDFCSTIAALFNVSVQSIVVLNNLPADCGTLLIGQKLLVPQPTPTASPLPTSTLSGAEATDAACDKVFYEVKASDTLGGIAANYNVSMDAIREYNGLPNDIVYEGQTVIIPLCERNPTPGPTPTETPPPPYTAANLLLPADGAPFTNINDAITLQWAAVGTLRQNEAYEVTVLDVTDGTGRKLTAYVTDTKYNVPSNFRPTGEIPHIIRWYVQPVRQTGTTTGGDPIWEPAGERSVFRHFSWWGIGAATPTP